MQPQVPPSPLRKLLQALVGLASLGLIGGAVLFALAQLGVVGFDRDGSAILAARRAMQSHLVAPGSARFPSGQSRIAARTADGTFRIAFIAADSQNKFGATLRSYGLMILGEDEGKAQVLHTQVFENSPTVSDVRKLMQEIGENWQIEDWLR